MIGGRYEPVEVLGTGGMATVWKARDTVLGRLVAIKRLLPHLASDPGISGRFQREAQASAGLNHPAIVTVYDTGSDENGAFIVLEYVEGETLADVLGREGKQDQNTVFRIVEQVGEALDYAHENGVVHRDVKPANLIVAADGTIRLADFGIARSLDDPATVTEPGDVVGTLTYMAPEAIEGGEINARSDIYSLAAVTYEMLSGRPPFEAGNVGLLLEKIRSGNSLPLQSVPDDIVSRIRNAMSIDPERRPATAGEFATSLVGATTRLLDPVAVAAMPVPTPGDGGEDTMVLSQSSVPSATTTVRSKAPLAAALVLAALLAAGYAVVSNQAEGVASPETTLLASTVTTTTIATTTTTTPTTTTVPTTVAVTPFTIADEIRDHLAELAPPEFRPKDVRNVSQDLDELMDAWAEGEGDLEKKLEDLLDSVGKLPESPQRSHLEGHVSELADAIGIEPDDDDDD